MDKVVSPTQFSPLDQIRQMESEITRKTAAAHEAANQMLTKARVDAGAVKNQALEDGNREGQARYQEIILEAKEEAKQFITLAQGQAEEISQRGDQHMEQAVQQVVEVVIGIEEDGEDA